MVWVMDQQWYLYIYVLYVFVDDVQVLEDSEKYLGLMLKIFCEQFDFFYEEVKFIRWKGNMKNQVI